jgi:hypothetical protein
LKIHFNIILPTMARSSKLSLFLTFHTKTMYAPLLPRIRAKCHARLTVLALITQIIFSEEYRS